MGTGKLWAFTLAVSVVVGEAAWGDDVSPSSSGNWLSLSRWFKPGKSSAPNDLDHHHHIHAAPSTPAMPAHVSDEQAQAQAIYNRRMDACLKLQRIASTTNDDSLRRKAELLEPLIWQQYLRRTSHLPGAPGVGGAVGSEQLSAPIFVPGKED